MLPRWHILLGAIFTLIIWISIPEMQSYFLALIFLSSFLIDFDHYVASGLKTGKWKLSDSFKYHKKILIQEKKNVARGIKKKGDFHLFHTLEFHLIIGVLGFFWAGFFYVFIGMVFHSFLDVLSLMHGGVFHVREFFFTNWLRRKIRKN